MNNESCPPGEKDASPYSADAPIASVAEDKLGRSRFAERIAEAIASWRDERSLVVAVLGEWGCGKTSLLNMALEHLAGPLSAGLADDKTPVIVRFNPWDFSNQNQLLRAFFRTMSNAIGRQARGDAVERLGRRLKVYAQLLAPAEFVFDVLPIPAAGGVIRRVRNALGNASAGATELAQALEQDHDAVRSEIDALLRELDRQVVVVIDDIDRLTKDEIRQLFQLVKLNADFANTAYLLAFDERLVGEALESSYGPDFVQKIVQVPLPVPDVSSERLQQLLFDEINEVLQKYGVTDFDNVQFYPRFIEGPSAFFTSLRHVRRYVNAVHFTLPLVKGEVNPAEFLLMEMIRVMRPTLHATLFRRRRFLTSSPSKATDEGKSELASLKAECGSEWDGAAALLKELFPAIEVTGGGAGYSTGWLDEWGVKRRVCHPRYFMRYFQFAVPEDAVTEAEFTEVWRAAVSVDSLRVALQDITEPRLITLLEMMRGHAADLPTEARPNVASALFDVGGSVRSLRQEILVADPNLLLRLVVEKVLEQLTPDERYTVIKRAAEESDAGTVAAYVHERDGDVERGIRAFSDDQLRELKGILLDRIRKQAVRREPLVQSIHFSVLFFLWLRWDNEDKQADKYLQGIVANETLMPYCLEVFVRDGWTEQGGYRTHQFHPMVDAVQCVGVGVLSDAMRRLTGDYLDRLTERQRDIVAFLADLTEDNLRERL